MTLFGVAIRSLFRNRTRSVLTVLAGAVAVSTFILLRTVLSAWNVAVDYAAKDRVATRDRVSFFMPLPRSYVDTVRQTRDVKAATFATWFGGKNPREPDDSFATLAVEPSSYLEVFDEIALPKDNRQQWLEDRRGAIVGEALAKKLNVKVGDKITLVGTIFPGEWQFTIDGVYETTRRSADRSWFLFHWDYLNESLPAEQRDKIGWTVARVNDAAKGPSVSEAIDRVFDERDVQTATMSERAMYLSFLSGTSVILTTLDLVSIIILVLMALILANTIAMGVRERVHEYGALRAIGFSLANIVFFVCVESVLLGVLSGTLGLAISYPLIEKGLGTFIEENMGGLFPYFRISAPTALAAVVCSAAVALLAGALPAFQASRISVTESLRRVE